MKKKEIIFMTLAVIFLGAGIYLSLTQNFSKKEEGTSRTNVNEEELVFTDITDNLDNVKYRNEIIPVEIREDQEDPSILHLFINNKDVYKTDSINMFIEKVYQFNDNILIITNGLNKNAIKIRIYKNDGTFVKEIRDLIIDNMKISEYEVLEKEIDLKGLRIANEHEFVLDGNLIDICDDTVLEENKIDKNMVVKGDYKLQYDVDSGFNVVAIDETEVKLEEYQNNSCIK